MERSQVFQSGNWIAAATTAAADAQPWPTSKLLPLVLLLSVAYVMASLCLTSLLGTPADDVFFIEDIAMFALLLVFWLLAQPFVARHTKKMQMIAKPFADDAQGLAAAQHELVMPSSFRGAVVFRARRAQRRRHLRYGLEQLQKVLTSLSDVAAASACASSSPGQSKRTSTASSHNVHNFHTAHTRPGGVLLPAEVAVCHYPPDVCEHVRRQLEDRWAVVDSYGVEKWLPSIPE